MSVHASDQLESRISADILEFISSCTRTMWFMSWSAGEDRYLLWTRLA